MDDDFSEIAKKVDAFALCMKSRLAAAYVNGGEGNVDASSPEVDEACKAFEVWSGRINVKPEFGDLISLECENSRSVPLDMLRGSVKEYLSRSNRLFGFLTTDINLEHYSRLSHAVIDAVVADDGKVSVDVSPILTTKCGKKLDSARHNPALIGRLKGLARYDSGVMVEYVIYSIDVVDPTHKI